MTKRSKNIILSLFMYGICFAFLFERKLSYPTYVFPYIIIAIIAIISTIILVKEFFKNSKKLEEISLNYRDNQEKKINYRKLNFTILTSFIYIFIFSWAGFYITSFIYLIVLLYILQPTEISLLRKLFFSLIISVIVCLLIYFLFDLLLDVSMPKGFFI